MNHQVGRSSPPLIAQCQGKSFWGVAAGTNQVLEFQLMGQTAGMACVLCGSARDPTDEDVIPKWLLRALDVQPGSTTVSVREEAGDQQEVRKLRHFQVTPDGELCRTCNNERLGGLEQAVQPILEPMAVRRMPTTPDVDSQRLLAVCVAKWTPDPAQAMTFESAEAAAECYHAVPYNRPLRPDGKPNRPLTFFTGAVW